MFVNLIAVINQIDVRHNTRARSDEVVVVPLSCSHAPPGDPSMAAAYICISAMAVGEGCVHVWLSMWWLAGDGHEREANVLPAMRALAREIDEINILISGAGGEEEKGAGVMRLTASFYTTTTINCHVIRRYICILCMGLGSVEGKHVRIMMHNAQI